MDLQRCTKIDKYRLIQTINWQNTDKYRQKLTNIGKDLQIQAKLIKCSQRLQAITEKSKTKLTKIDKYREIQTSQQKLTNVDKDWQI